MDETRRSDLPTGLVAAATFLVALALLLLLLRPGPERAPRAGPVSDDEVSAFEAAVARDLPDIAIRPVTALRIRATRVTWADDAGESWLAAPRLAFTLSLGPGPAPAVLIADGVLENPTLRLVERAPGEWNFQPRLAALFADDGPRPTPAPGADVQLRNIVIRGGTITVATLDATYRATGVRADLASAVLAGPRVDAPSFHLRTAEGSLTLPDTPLGPVTRTVAVQDARVSLPDGAVAFDVARVGFGASVAVDLRGILDPALAGLGLDATARVQRLELADVPWLQVEAPEDGIASFDLRVQPLVGDRSAIAITGFDLRSETSAATGSLRAVYGPAGFALESIDARVDPLSLSLIAAFTGPLPYVGELRGTIRGTAGDIAFDLAASLATSPLADRFMVDLEGRLAFTDPGVALRLLVARFDAVPLAALEPLVPGIPFQGPVSGTVRMEGPPGDVPIRLDVRLEAGGGLVTMAGTLDLRGAAPAYDLAGRVVGVDLQQVLEPAVPPARLNAAFRLAGSGTALDAAHATLEADGGFTGWRAAPGDTLALRLELIGGLLRAHQLRLALGPVDLAAEGDWRFANGAGGAIRYALRVASLEPLAPYLPTDPGRPMAFARGAIAAEGTLSGTLDAPTLAGRVQATDFRYDDWAAGRFEGTYEVVLGPGMPRVIAELEGRDLVTPAGAFARATVSVQLVEPAFSVAIHGVRPRQEGVVVVEADGRIDDTGFRDIFLRRIELDLERQRWRLPAPARITWTEGDVLRIEDLRIERADGAGVIRLHGTLAPLDLMDIEIELAALPTGDLAPFLLPQVALDGELWATGTLRGPAAAPVLDLDVQLRNGTIQEVAVPLLQARATYIDGAFRIVGDATVGDTAAIAIEADLPITLVLGFPPALELDGDGPVSVRLRAEDFPLATLDPAIPAFRDLVGRTSADILLTGTPADPQLAGGVTLVDGGVTIPLLNQRYRQIEGTAILDGQILRVERLVAVSDGSALVTGTVRLDDLTNPGLSLRARLDGFRAQGVSGRRDAAITGDIDIGGTALLPAIGGAITADDGTLSLAILDRPPRFDGELIGIAERFTPLFPGDLEAAEPVDRGVRVTRLDITAGPDLWFQTDEMRIQLSGDLTITMPGPDPIVVGELTGTRGTFSLRIGPATRRFDIVSASLRFFGTPDPDPAIDIVATRVIPGPNRMDFDLNVRLTGTLAAPAVAFATAEGTTIPQEEALNFLIFGRATATLADFPGGGLGTTQTALDALAFYGAFDWLSAAVADQFGAGIDYFQIQVRPGVGDAGTEVFFILGQEIVQDVFVLVTVPTSEFEARWAVATEWRIDRQWTLEAGYEPPDMVVGIGGMGGRGLPFAAERDQQLFLSIRRRWSY